MSQYSILICRSCTEAIGLRRHLGQMGVPGEVTRPPRHAQTESCGWAVRVGAGQADEALHLSLIHISSGRRLRHVAPARRACAVRSGQA